MSQPPAPVSVSIVEMVCVMVTMSCTGPFCRLMSLHATNITASSAPAPIATIFVVFLIPPLQPFLRGSHDARRDEDQQLVVRVVDVVCTEQRSKHRDLMQER